MSAVRPANEDESLRNVSEVIGGEYGDRAIFELVQNAHDAHEDGEEGSILLKLVIKGPDSGDLFVANKGKEDEAANYSFVLRGYVRHWLANVWSEFDRIKLTDLVGAKPGVRGGEK